MLIPPRLVVIQSKHSLTYPTYSLVFHTEANFAEASLINFRSMI